jgi:hypothetical protein
MYCSLEEAWPDHHPKVQNTNHFENNIVNTNKNNSSISISEDEYKEYIKFKENSNKNITEHFSNELTQKINNPKLNHKKNIYIDSDSEIDSDHEVECNKIIKHIGSCKKCLNKIYAKYRCSGNKSDNFMKMFSKEQKDLFAVVLLGIIIIIILQILCDKKN